MPPGRQRAIRRCGVEYRLPVRASRTPHTRSAPLPLVGRGWGWGSESVDTTRATTMTPLPSPPPTQVGLARLAQDKTRPGQARGAWGREQTESAARTDSNSLDHLIRAGDEHIRQRPPDGRGRLEVDRHVKAGRLS